ncbi:MAG: hypothetical protein ACM3QX_18395 [Syntrophomonadaceae bacterium]
MTYKQAMQDLYGYFHLEAPDLFPELEGEAVPAEYLGLMLKLVKMVFYPTGRNSGSKMHQRLKTISEHAEIKAQYRLLRRRGLTQTEALDRLSENRSYSGVRNIVLNGGYLNSNDYFVDIVKCFADIKVKKTMNKGDYNEGNKGKGSWDSVSQVWRHRDLPGHGNRR